MKIKFVSLISKENHPLYTQQFTVDSDDEFNDILKYNFLSHMALDVFESPYGPEANSKATPLFVNDDIHVFGNEMLTGLKIVIGCSKTESEETEASIAKLSEVMNEIKREYVRYSSNPFFKTSSVEVKSAKFDSNIKEIVDVFNKGI